MKFILGTKRNMVQFFTEDGACIPATVVDAGPVTVTQVKTPEKDGYSAVQVGFGKKNPRKMNKALAGHVKDASYARFVKEFAIRGGGAPSHAVGDIIGVDVFEVGDVVTVSGVSKGKGFQGVVKRHGFGGGPRSHGQRHSEREPGSIGATGPQRVFKGTRMAGRMGGDRVTVKNLRVLGVDKENNILLVSGAVPGKRGTLLEVRGEN